MMVGPCVCVCATVSHCTLGNALSYPASYQRAGAPSPAPLRERLRWTACVTRPSWRQRLPPTTLRRPPHRRPAGRKARRLPPTSLRRLPHRRPAGQEARLESPPA
eukprot:scaffold30388_cov95-Isochrysis_galbana.AAC.3